MPAERKKKYEIRRRFSLPWSDPPRSKSDWDTNKHIDLKERFGSVSTILDSFQPCSVESVYAGSNATCPTEEAHAAQRKVYGRRVGVPERRGGVGDMVPAARISSGWVARGLRHEAARWRRSLDSDVLAQPSTPRSTESALATPVAAEGGRKEVAAAGEWFPNHCSFIFTLTCYQYFCSSRTTERRPMPLIPHR
jgi:hypothetical protein